MLKKTTSIISAFLFLLILATPANAVTSQFFAQGNGTFTLVSPSNCFSVAPKICVTKVTNQFSQDNLNNIGKYSAIETVNWGLGTTTFGKTCAPATITKTISGSKGTINIVETGTACGFGNPTLVHTFNGTFTITGGTGSFTAASGSGNVPTSLYLSTRNAFQLFGSINY